MPADLADIPAAQTEGYNLTQQDRGAAAVPRYFTMLSKPIQGDGTTGGRIRQIQGRGDSSQALADANALSSLNAVRRYIYGTDATNVNKGQSGNALVVGKH